VGRKRGRGKGKAVGGWGKGARAGRKNIEKRHETIREREREAGMKDVLKHKIKIRNMKTKTAYILGCEKELLLTAVRDETSAARSSLLSLRSRSLSPFVWLRQKHEARAAVGGADGRGIAQSLRSAR
jgi:hypothetical protein